MGEQRSTRAEVRNPVLLLPSADALRALPPESRAALAAVLADISRDANERAQASWAKSKGPMAAYWKAVSVYAKHIKRAAQVAA